MIPPTSIDGTDITGATIDGTDVQEITVDGQTVFTAGASNLPVAYSNLVAWYPFDSATYGGNNADDVTAILGGSGDDTAYDGTVNGATYQSSGGVTDIRAGANSGAFDFDGSNDGIDVTYPGIDFDNPFTIMVWANADAISGSIFLLDFGLDSGLQPFVTLFMFDNFFRLIPEDDTGSNQIISTTGATTGTDFHIASLFDGSTFEIYVNGTLEVSQAKTIGSLSSIDYFEIGNSGRRNQNYFDGTLDDIRIYNTNLSASQIQSIYNNTKP